MTARRFVRLGLAALTACVLIPGCSKNDDAATGTSSQRSSSGDPGGATGAPSAPAEPPHPAAANLGPDPFCEGNHKPVADKAACRACEQSRCDTSEAPGCTRFPEGSPERTKCEDVLTCVRSTGCIIRGNVNCYCGSADVVACKGSAADANGACKERIAAAFPKGYSAAKIVDQIGTVTIPGGAALALAECDLARCGENAGKECLPYCSK